MEEEKKRHSSEYPNTYEYKREHQWKCLDLGEGEGYAKVISFFKPKSRGQTFNITSKVFQPRDLDFTIKCETMNTIELIKDKMYTKKLTKGKRITLRKDFLEIPEYEVYTWVSLYNYLIQAYKESSKYVLLNSKEWYMIQPTLTKKEQRKRKQDKALRCLVGY